MLDKILKQVTRDPSQFLSMFFPKVKELINTYFDTHAHKAGDGEIFVAAIMKKTEDDGSFEFYAVPGAIDKQTSYFRQIPIVIEDESKYYIRIDENLIKTLYTNNAQPTSADESFEDMPGDTAEEQKYNEEASNILQKVKDREGENEAGTDTNVESDQNQDDDWTNIRQYRKYAGTPARRHWYKK